MRLWHRGRGVGQPTRSGRSMFAPRHGGERRTADPGQGPPAERWLDWRQAGATRELTGNASTHIRLLFTRLRLAGPPAKAEFLSAWVWPVGTAQPTRPPSAQVQ